MAETLDIIEKLIRLATNNPNEAEATAAAIKAVQLIADNNVPLGNVRPTRAKSKWTQQEESEFKETLDAILTRPNPDNFKPEMHMPEPELDDEFMKKRIIKAWREVRELRAQFRTEVDRWEKQTRQRYNWSGGQPKWW